MLEDKIIGGILGVVTGDALGLSVQFLSRSEIRQKPVTGMRAGGAFNTPAGTWSDDSSLTLCLVESLVERGYDVRDIADRFVRWYSEGYWTPFGEAFDVGGATAFAMQRLMKGASPLEAGPDDEHSNGNGSLMRILPAALYFAHLPEQDLIAKICEVSRITHGHPRSLLGCSLYALLVQSLLTGRKPEEAYADILSRSETLFQGTEMERELPYYQRILDGTLPKLNDDLIESSGYVVHTLEAALWCLLTSQSFAETLLKAVNLGDDADTVGAVTGGLAGIFYGFSLIPEEWVKRLIRSKEILSLARRFAGISLHEKN